MHFDVHITEHAEVANNAEADFGGSTVLSGEGPPLTASSQDRLAPRCRLSPTCAEHISGILGRCRAGGPAHLRICWTGAEEYSTRAEAKAT